MQISKYGNESPFTNSVKSSSGQLIELYATELKSIARRLGCTIITARLCPFVRQPLVVSENVHNS